MRPIMFSCFNPDIALLARLKQPVFPVFLLTSAGKENLDGGILADPRGASLYNAVQYSQSVPFMGIVTDVTPICKAGELIPAVRHTGLMLWSYGKLNNEPENVSLQSMCFDV